MIWQQRQQIITDVSQKVKHLSNFFNGRIHKLSIMLEQFSQYVQKIRLFPDIWYFMINDLFNNSSPDHHLAFLENIDFNYLGCKNSNSKKEHFETWGYSITL